MARLPDAEVMLAAASPVIGLEITIESSVITLLATTTSLARGPRSYDVLRRFTLYLNVDCTVGTRSTRGVAGTFALPSG